MRALIVRSARNAAVEIVPDPAPGTGDLLVQVERVGICGTDVELYSGEMAYIAQGLTTYPIRLGHEWTGRVIDVGTGVDSKWIGKRITGDTMLGCGECSYCLNGNQHVCPNRREVGITDGWPGALAEKLVLPERFAFEIPESIGVAAAAMVEPGGNSLRAVRAAELSPGKKLLILGPGTVGLLAVQFAFASGAEIHLAGERENSLALGRELGAHKTYSYQEISNAGELFDAVIDATSLTTSPQLSIKLLKPGGRLVLIGLSGTPSLIDSRDLAFKDATAIGILSASPGLQGTIDLYASGQVKPEILVSEVIGLEDVPSRLEGKRGKDSGPGPKIHVDPRI